MKRSRTSSSSKSVENIASGSKDEPPKKVAKKRVKSVTQSPVNQNASEQQPPVLAAPVVKHSPRPNSASKLGSLPMYGEDLPDEGYASIPKLAEKVCGNLKTVMDRVKDCKLKGGSKADADVEMYKQKGLVLFVSLKKLNRLSHMYCKEAREHTHEQKLGVDDLHLQLQNLMYEAMHLRKEIKNCLEFKSQHEEIDLISEEEITLQVPDTVLDDEHQRMLKRLEWELENRKLLALQQGNLEKQLSKEEVGIRQKEDHLSNILPTLEGIRKATLPLQDSLGIPLDKKREEHDYAMQLPPSLYILYMQAKAYSEIQDPSVSVSICGDVGEARAFQVSQQDNSDEDSGDSDNEGEERKKRRKQEKSLEKKISKAHPLAVTCSISVKDIGSFQFTFQHLPHFSVVCTSVADIKVDGISDDQLSAHMDKACLLHCLMADSDTGRTSPNAIVSFHIRKHGNDVFSSAVRNYGFPYKWAQNVCGISDDVELPETASYRQQADISAEHIESVMLRLKSRFRSQVYLLNQVIQLSSDEHKLVLGPDTESLPSNRTDLKLVKWKQLSPSDVQACSSQFVSQSIFTQQDRMNKFYEGQFEHEKGTLKCVTCICSDYPHTPPVHIIKIEDTQGREVPEVQIKSLEADVNIHFPKTLKGSDKNGKYLLSRQLNRMQSCFSTYLDSATNKGNKIKGKGRLVILEQ